MAKPNKIFYRLNQFISAPQVRLIDENNKQIGIVSREEALKKAQELEIDLVEVAPNARPPVCRLIDYKKFKYLQSRKEKEERKKIRQVELKEVRMGPFVAPHDLQVRLTKIREFLTDGHRVKLTIRFGGRQMAHPEFGHKLVKRILDELGEAALVAREPKFEGRNLTLILAQAKGKKKEEESAQSQNTQSSPEAV